METGNPHVHEPPQKIEYGTLKFYLVGFALSILLNLITYWIGISQAVTGIVSDTALAVFGIIQAIVQLIFFLHVLKEPKPRWNLVMFYFMLMVLVIIVFGSVWIMDNLNYNL